jgi:branched-chain amino acid transport system permease protein
MSRLSERSLALRPAAWTVLPRGLSPLVIAVLVGLAMFYIGPNLGGSWTEPALTAGISIILAVSLTVVNGFTGQFSMGHAGFMALGGYTAAAITYYGSMRYLGSSAFAGGLLSYNGVEAFTGGILTMGDMLFVASCLSGGLVAALAGYIVGLPSLRLRGDYLAIVTLGFGEILRVILQGSKPQIFQTKVAEVQAASPVDLAWSLGGAQGFNMLPTYSTFFWVYAFATLTLIVCYRLKLSSSGRAFLSIREDEVASQAMGVNTTKYKVRAFVLSSFFAGVAGGLYAMKLGTINAANLGFQKSFDIIIMVVLGGMGSISGAALAAIILTFLPELLREMGGDLQQYRIIIYAALLVIMMLVRPQGLFGIREIWEVPLFRRMFYLKDHSARGTSGGGGGAAK